MMMTNKATYKRLGDYIRQVDVRNKDLGVDKLVGLTIDKAFIPSVANTIGTDLSNYKVISKNQFACSLMQVSRDGKMPIAMFKEDKAIMSPAYPMFEVSRQSELIPEFLMMWFSRSEFDRQAAFYAVGGVRGSLTWEDFCDFDIPVPPIDEQRKIVAEYQAIERRIENNRRLIATLETTAQAIYRHTFVDNIDSEKLPKGWRIGTLQEITQFISAGTIPIYVEESEYLVLGQKCNFNHTISLEKARRHSPKSSVIQCELGDILVNSTGDGTLGRVGLIRFKPINLSFDSNMTLARPLDKKWAEFVFLTMLNMESYFIQICQGSTNQTRLYCSMIRHARCLIPSIKDVEKFHIQTQSLIRYQGQLEQEIKVFTDTAHILLTKLSNL